MIKIEIRFCDNLNANIVWKNNEAYHRLDGPAITYSDGKQIWHKEGRLHRDDGPAFIYPSVIKEWYKEGEFTKRELND